MQGATTNVEHQVSVERPSARASRSAATVARFYEASLGDQRTWSPKLNLHFGYYRRGVSVLDREALLDEMNAQVVARLELPRDGASFVLDAGCGVGPTARFLAKRYRGARVLGLTLSGRQRDVGNMLTMRARLHPRVRLEVGDYLSTGLETGTVDAAYAVESACYAPGRDKASFFREMARVLRPGGRLVVADAFLRRSAPLPAVAERAHAAMCAGWELAELASIEDACAAARRAGLDVRAVEDVSWRVMPSVAHVPLAMVEQLWRDPRAFTSGPRRGNLVAPLAAALAGLHLAQFGYFFVVAQRGGR